MVYKLTSGWPQDTVTGSFVNPDGAVYLAFLAGGGTPEPADVPSPSEAALAAIRATEQTPIVADAMQRGSRLVALSYAIDDLIRVAAAKGLTVTRQQAHDWAMLNDSNYKTLYDAEQIIKPLRALV